MFAALTLRLWPYLAGVLLLCGIWWHGEHYGANRVQRKFDTYVAAQEARVGEIRTAWDKERAVSEVTALRHMERREVVFQPLIARAHALPPEMSHIRVDPVAVQLLDDAIRAANSTGAATEPAEAPTTGAQPALEPGQSLTAGHAQTLPEAQPLPLPLLLEWQVATLEWAAECKDRVQAWSQFYSGLRDASKEQP